MDLKIHVSKVQVVVFEEEKSEFFQVIQYVNSEKLKEIDEFVCLGRTY